MSQTDSFIEEVTEEVRRDRLFLLLKRYGWIGVLVVLLIVGGAAWREYSRAQDRAEAEALGDSMLAALESEDPEARITALGAVEAGSAGGVALLGLLTAAEQSSADQEAEAAETLGAIAANGEVPQIYRDIAGFRMLLLQSDTLEADARRTGFEALARAGSPLRLLAEEQIALIDVETGDSEAAIEKFQAILEDAEVTAGLRQRVSQVIVALGGELDAA
ncbi:tetratricopeptide repeat protein [Marinovum sp.]|uniref:tetratricopeptide repeat protein n=1 Tax=Marinovum sp. TaxID=2024839 RepID=UPI002B27780C|nr:tetratricopeptide repeat protein [Marinovum sp.]